MNGKISFLFKQISSYWQYRKQAKTRYAIHSPFVYRLIEDVLRDRKFYPEYGVIKQYNKTLLKTHKYLSINDLGSGSKRFSSNKRKISQMARTSGSRPKEQKLLFRLARYFNARNMLELGTHLGQGALALALASPGGKILSLEGDASLVEFTRTQLQKFKVNNVSIIEGNFDDLLPGIVQNHTFDFIFIDGNHRLKPTLHYVKTLKESLAPTGFFMIDDIHWNDEMENAWQKLIEDPGFHVTIDLFCCGLLFFRPEQQKEHFVLKF